MQQATQQILMGMVTDNQGALSGVTIAVKGKTATTITDNMGNFSIAATTDDTLVITYVGYKTQELTVRNYEPLVINLEEDVTALQEVTVNAGYYNVKESERTGSIAKISSKEIATQPVSNTLAAMQGRLAGVNITQTTGTPGGGFNLQIRGINSLRADGNAPLYIIDGVPYSSESIGYVQSNTIHPTTTSPLNNLNPGDIESLEVLKDADATAIYGSRGANGVVLVTTKKGKKGKTTFTANMSKGIGEVTRFMKLMNTEQYLAMRAEAFTNDGFTTIPAIAYDINGTWDQNRYTDWQKELLGGTAEITNLSSSLSGGSEYTQFMISGNFNKETTVFPGDFAYKKGNIRVNLNHTSTDGDFNVNFSAGYTLQDNDQPSRDLTAAAMSTPPNAPALYTGDGELNWENNTFTNPLASQYGKSLAKSNDLVSNMVLSYRLPLGFQAKVNLGYTSLNHKERNTTPSTIYNPSFNFTPSFSSIFVSRTERQSWIVEPQLDWKRNLGKARLELLAGSTFQKQDNGQLALMGSGFPSNSLIYNLAAASYTQVMLDNESEYKYQAIFGRANLNWDKRFIVNFTGRRDGSSRFGPGRQFANFGAVGAAWIFSNEQWLRDNAFLSFGKLRASYGTTGNDQIGNYQFLNTFSTTGITYEGIIGLQPTRLYNPDFGWEENKKLEIALETGVLNDRIFLTWAWYRNRSSNQLVGIPLPATTGFNSLQANLGAEVENSGVELTLRTINIKRDKFSWTTDINFSTSKNKLLSFPGLESTSYVNQYVIGQPLNIVKVFKYTGLDPQTGIYTFADVNGDGIISAPDDRQTIKDLNPKFFGGIQNQIRYGPVQLDFLFQFVKQENYNSKAMFGRPGTMSNQPAEVVNHWSQAGDDAPYQILTAGANPATNVPFSRFIASDAAISDASYIRLKNVSLTYDVPKRWTGSVGCRVSLQGQNVLTLTSYKGADPEFRTLGFTPPLRVFTAGLNLTL
ncbi:SusC/RagA family TonB-linked outer membrane protein [Flavobacterium sp.]|uniref:SusC/RagA family TonB-linked outer membrane protein n=1 Tax=Flavobacterium sp. TaxID=239 RepID=UPI0025B9825A|nr:SusC/RagA family TonB-linked outer membrane protein [Flavobacterium sp.]